MVLPDFVKVVRGSAAHEESFLCLSRRVVTFSTHFAGYSLICPGQDCELCRRGFKVSRLGAVVGGSKSGELALLLVPVDRFRPRLEPLGHVFSHAPWRRGQCVKWFIGDDVRPVRPDQVVDDREIARVLLRTFLPESKRGLANQLGNLTAARGLLLEAAKTVALRTTFDF